MVKTNTKKERTGAFVTRTQAVRYLQVSLSDFRRLCILKGIYPRELTGKSKKKVTNGSTRQVTAYYLKDIKFLMYEPILQKFRDQKVFARKLTRLIGRGDIGDAKRLDDNRPSYTLDHIVKERYPTFSDALGDLDDALSTLFLFARMPATDKVSSRITEDAERLSTEWMAYVAREHLLRKVFVSIKGVYYSANIRGQEIIWVVPFNFPQNIPSDIDFRIMLTFLEFYTTLLHFVLYRLYTEKGLVYPPPIKQNRANGVGGISAYILDSQPKLKAAMANKNDNDGGRVQDVKVQLDRAREADANAEGENVEDEADDKEANNDATLDEFEAENNDGDILAQPSNKGEDLLFSGLVFFVGREVPLDIVEFCILSQGGKLISESALDEDDSGTPDMDAVTHQITDRPALTQKVPSRIYVQPQWLFDSINQGKLVSVDDYAAGKPLPPHLSPWGDRGSYDPEEEKAADADELQESEHDEKDEIEGDKVEDEVEDDEEEEEDSETERQKEIAAEAAGRKPSEKKRSQSKKVQKPDEEKELRKMMMTKKQRKLYGRMQHGIDKRQSREDSLRKKKRKLSEKST